MKRDEHSGAMPGDADEGNGENSRREFLKRAALASASTLFLPATMLGWNGGGLGACTPTSTDVEGPFYKSGSPYRMVLASPNEPGERLAISGVVYARDCATPIVGAIVDVWAANHEGCYDNGAECNPHSDDPFNLRGRMLTNERGEYGFSTIKPGRYPNAGTLRPSHLHFKVSIPGRQPLTTQLYFEGDPYIPGDPFASEPEAAPRIIPLSSANSVLTGTFDITLNVAPGTSGVDVGAMPGRSRLLANQPNPFRDATAIGYEVARPGRVHLTVHSTLGERVRTLVSSVHEPGVYHEHWDGLDDSGVRVSSGIYTCRLQVESFVQSMTMIRMS